MYDNQDCPVEKNGYTWAITCILHPGEKNLDWRDLFINYY